MFTIKQTNNIPIIMALHEETFPDDEQYIYDTNKYWIVCSGKEPVGFTILNVLDDEIGFLARTGISQAARGKGIHKRLIRVRERYARKIGLKYLITYTVASNIISAHNLENQGYRLYMPDYDYAGDDVLYFRKDL